MSDFIESRGNFVPNPIVNSLVRLDNLFDLLICFTEKGLMPHPNNNNDEEEINI
ncbi:hypothetical protein MTBMA_c14670 [Methanothermobacter marburgensis str. Marburg]|uniref:Uncharacterized protein n=1 Tax=Methanothermobacter marburgensis (strain ATCC BAA-927 / DSM 2133 / JCM 14651 / NBRC 100331 / OCM 82 / Marburg) TaxID=79929 RepID=D9PXU8_METTM|nr:hypothetical protein MTBMA_c14670 [Methanothermobacter marburgensis str. Marburg]